MYKCPSHISVALIRSIPAGCIIEILSSSEMISEWSGCPFHLVKSCDAQNVEHVTSILHKTGRRMSDCCACLHSAWLC